VETSGFNERRRQPERSRNKRDRSLEETQPRVGAGGRNLKKGDADHRLWKLKRYAFIDDEKRTYPLRILCRVMEVSAGGYYAWRKRLSKPPCLKRKTLRQLVSNCYFENRRRYGARRIAKAITKTGTLIGRRKVRGLMNEEGLQAIQTKRFQPQTTDSKGTTAAPNLLAEIKLEECAPRKIIIGDITYIRLRGGKFCYLAVWQDKVTRRIIGWSLELEMTQELVISALQTAIRKELVKAGAIVHSDRGSQYAANAFRELLRTEGFRQSMSGKGALL
jgi:putative transposase